MAQPIPAMALAQKLNAQLVGNANALITGMNSLRDAQTGDISFLANKKYEDLLKETQASVVLVGKDIAQQPKEGQAFLVCDDPNTAFAMIGEAFAPPPPQYPVGIHPTAVVAPDAKIGENVSIGPQVVVESGAEIGDGTILVAQVYVGHQAKIGQGCILYPFVMVRERCLLGNKVILHSGVVIGGDGFGFAPTAKGIFKIPQFGIVQIDDNVEIGANSTVDRARFGRTWIQAHTKIDNLVMVAHNVQVGQACFLVSQCGIAGSAELGHGVIMGAKSGVNGHIHVGDGTQIAGTSSLAKGCPPKSVMLGTPAEPQREFMTRYTMPKTMKKLEAKVKELEAKIKALENQ